MDTLIHHLDKEVAEIRANLFAKSTQAAYRTHRDTYLEFCRLLGISSVPATSQNICRYIAYLARKRRFSTVQQYIGIIRLIHLELGLANPFKDNWMVSSLLKGLKRKTSSQPKYKLPLSTSDLLKVRACLNLDNPSDNQLWVACLLCFFGLLRISSVAVDTVKDVQNCFMTKQDAHITTSGLILSVKKSKTIQFNERTLEVAIPFIRDNPLCPTSAFLRFLGQSGTVKPSDPLLAYCSSEGKLHVLHKRTVLSKLKSILGNIGLNPTEYGTHSLRRGGATWLLLCGVSVPIIKTLGDWKTDCVFKYLKPDTLSKLRLLNGVASSLKG